MANRSVPVSESISWGWQTTLKNGKIVIPFYLLFIAVMAALNGAGNHRAAMDAGFSSGGQLFSLLGFLVELAFTSFALRMGFDLYDGKQITWGSVFKVSLGQYGKVLASAILLAVIGLVGFLLAFIGLYSGMLIPSGLQAVLSLAGLLLALLSIYWSIAYHFAPYAVIERDSGVMESFGISGAATKGVKWQLIGLGVVQLGVILLGAVALGIGLLWAVPTVTLSTVYVYKKLAEAPATAPAATPSEEQVASPIS